MGLSGPAYWGRLCQSCVFNLLQPTCSSSQRWLTLFSWSSAFPRTQADVSWGEEDAAKNHRVKNVSGASPSREVLNNRSKLSDELLCGFAVVISWYSTRLSFTACKRPPLQHAGVRDAGGSEALRLVRLSIKKFKFSTKHRSAAKGAWMRSAPV